MTSSTIPINKYAITFSTELKPALSINNNFIRVIANKIIDDTLNIFKRYIMPTINIIIAKITHIIVRVKLAYFIAAKVVNAASEMQKKLLYKYVWSDNNFLNIIPANKYAIAKTSVIISIELLPPLLYKKNNEK